IIFYFLYKRCNMSKRIAILGSTGSIGTQALDIISKSTDFDVVALSAHSNMVLLERQIQNFKPEQVTITDESSYHDFLDNNKYQIKINLGIDGLKEMISEIDVDIILIAIVGIAALEVTYYAVSKGLDIALSNKESIV